MHDVAILALHGVVPSDLAIPGEVFGWARAQDGRPVYQVRICGEEPLIRSATFDLAVRHSLADLVTAQTVIVPGTADLGASVSADVIQALRAAAARGVRLASVCTGAFVLAATGLLDGRRATTHWLAAAELKQRYPAINVDPDVLYVDQGDLITSAGASAALDMCLHLVGRDHGQAVAAEAARAAVAPLRREGGQAQFIRRELPRSRSTLSPLLAWILENLHSPMTLAGMARRAGMSERTLNRRFHEEFGTSPLQWLLQMRVRRAQELLESTEGSINAVGQAAGFATPSVFRERFGRTVGVSPGQYRRTFRRTTETRSDRPAPGLPPHGPV
jgi:transcriptional regulator GlxA family with amidase domain